MLIPIIPKTDFSFDGRTSTTQTVVLKERIRFDEMVSAVLEVRVHARGAWTSSSANANIKVYPQSVSPEEPGTLFTHSTPLATCTVNTSGPLPATVPGLLSAQFATTPITSAAKVVLEFAQGATPASAAQTFTISVDISARPA